MTPASNPEATLKTQDEIIRDLEGTLADRDAKLSTALDAKYRAEKRLERALHAIEDHLRSLDTLRAEIHDTLISGGRW